jgi:guanosine-3',5'-bis(diphosphate) 3'-pyrophosphohydrolase
MFTDHPTKDILLWQKAASFAAFKHRHQLRKDQRTPYVAHPFRVAMTIRQVFDCNDAEILAAALMHDLIEDTTTDYEDLLKKFGKSVADLVAAMTKNMALPEAPREAQYDQGLANADWRARLIKLGDTYDNLCDSMASPESGVPVEKAAEKARRAIELTAGDTAAHPASARAVAALNAVLKSAGARMSREEFQP